MTPPVIADLTLGELIRLFRDRERLHNAELAARLHISNYQLNRLLADELALSYDLGVTLEEMMGMTRQGITAARERGRQLRTATGAK